MKDVKEDDLFCERAYKFERHRHLFSNLFLKQYPLSMGTKYNSGSSSGVAQNKFIVLKIVSPAFTVR